MRSWFQLQPDFSAFFSHRISSRQQLWHVGAVEQQINTKIESVHFVNGCVHLNMRDILMEDAEVVNEDTWSVRHMVRYLISIDFCRAKCNKNKGVQFQISASIFVEDCLLLRFGYL